MKVFFDKIAKLLKENKISRDELCKVIGIGRTSYWNWENNKTAPKEIFIKAIANKLNVSITEISDLKSNYPISENKISNIAPHWIDLTFKSNPQN